MKIEEKFNSLSDFVENVDGTKALEFLLPKIDWKSMDISEGEIIRIIDIKKLAELIDESWIEKYPFELKKRIEEYARKMSYSAHHVKKEKTEEIFKGNSPKVFEFFSENYSKFYRNFVLAHPPPGAE